MIYSYTIDNEINARDYLLSFYLAKSKVYKLFFEKRVSVNDNIINENYKLLKGDILKINITEEIDFIPEDKKIDIVYEDDYFLIINKPKGIIVHPDDKSKGNTLCNMVASYYKKIGLNINVRYAHRLDYDTTGIIIFVKDYLSFSYMNHYIETHDVKRTYRCLVTGIINKKEGQIVAPISGDRHNSKKFVVSKNGKEAITNYKVIKEYKDYSLVEVLLKTGRTHQIRCHMAYINHPLLGDLLYGANTKLINRVALHSYKLSFIHPIFKREVNLKLDLPSDMKGLV